MSAVTVYQPDSFNPEAYWYPKVMNAQLHPLVSFFMTLGNERIVERYSHLNPKIDKEKLLEICHYKPQYFNWAGSDLFHAATEDGRRQMVILETNSCPAGPKSFPLLNVKDEMGSYRTLIEKTIKHVSSQKRLPQGGIAVLHDKNTMEVAGYSAAISEIFDEPVYCATFYDGKSNSHIKFDNGVLNIRHQGKWLPMRMAFRRVLQRPWNRIPIVTKTLMINPIIVCLAGGRNKLMAAKAYDLFNAELEGTGLKIITPKTVWDVSKNEIPLWVESFKYKAVIKVPYSNAGQGVYTIVNKDELEKFMDLDPPYDKFIVQSLIGNYSWAEENIHNPYYIVGSMPSATGKSYVFDLRLIISHTKNGFNPQCMFSRRAKSPLTDELSTNQESSDMLVTNISSKVSDVSWNYEPSRLWLMDERDFDKLGLGLDSLIEAYIQTVLATVAIDKMAIKLMSSKGNFKKRLFRSLNNDEALISEILGAE